MSNLALLGGNPVRARRFPAWPRCAASDIRRVTAVLESGNWGGFPFPNRFAGEFAQKFAGYHGAQYGCCVLNGTIALEAALRASGIRYGDEVIVPAYTWDGTAGAVLFAGGVPVFADIDPDTYCIDVEAARRAITPRTRAIIPVHLAMRFAAMDALLAMAAENRLTVIEDCAHVHGATYNGRGAGSMGDLGCFSFQSSKLMTAGEGGIVITSRQEIFEILQSIVNCGRASVTDRFKARVAGSNYRITELQAALLLGQLDQLPELTDRRAMNAALLTERLATISGISPLPARPEITRPAFYSYVFRFRDHRVSRDLFAAALEAEGIPCDGRFYEPVYRSELFHATSDQFAQLEGVDYLSCRCPVSERAAYDEAVWLPQFVLLGDTQDIDDIARAVTKVIANLNELAAADPALAGAKAISRAERPIVGKERNY